jgi:uncharacterized membrane protein
MCRARHPAGVDGAGAGYPVVNARRARSNRKQDKTCRMLAARSIVLYNAHTVGGLSHIPCNFNENEGETMSNLIVITFDNMEEAGKVRESIRQQEKGGQISLDDSAVVVKDENGKVHVKNQMDRGVKIGAVGGGLLGLLLAGIFFPVAGIVVGVLGGMGVGALADLGIQKKFVQEVSEAIENGTSAIFLIVRNSNPNAALAALRPYKGTVYHTSLDPEDEKSVRDVLSRRVE